MLKPGNSFAMSGKCRTFAGENLMNMDTSDIMRRLAPFYDADKEARERQKRTAESLEEAVLQECRGLYEGGKLFRIYDAINGKTLHYIKDCKVDGLIGAPFNMGVGIACTVMSVDDRAYGFEWPRPLAVGWNEGHCFYLIGKDCAVNQWIFSSAKIEEVTMEDLDAETKRTARVDAIIKDAKLRSIRYKDGVWYRDYLDHGKLRKGHVTAFDEATGLFTVIEKGEKGEVKLLIKRPGQQLWLFGVDGEPGPGDLNII